MVAKFPNGFSLSFFSLCQDYNNFRPHESKNINCVKPLFQNPLFCFFILFWLRLPKMKKTKIFLPPRAASFSNTAFRRVLEVMK
jgi:hypothetical protein